VADSVCAELSEVHAAAESFQDAAVAQVSYCVVHNEALAIARYATWKVRNAELVVSSQSQCWLVAVAVVCAILQNACVLCHLLVSCTQLLSAAQQSSFLTDCKCCYMPAAACLRVCSMPHACTALVADA
jgi:hypothetical protein